MKIEINAEIPCSVFCKGKQFQTPFDLTTPYSEVLQLSILPAHPDKYHAYTLVVNVEKDKLVSISGGAKAVCWGEGLAEIRLFPPLSISNFSPEVSCQKKLSYDLVTLYDDGRKKIMCEGTSFFNFDLPVGILDCKMKAKEEGRGAIIAVDGKTEEGKEYLLALHSNGREWRVMHEITADKITTSPKGVKTIEILPTMLRHEKRAFYLPFENKPKEVTYVASVRHTYPDELIPYLFFEEIFIGNSDALNLIHPDLCDSIDTLKEFLGDVDTVEFPKTPLSTPDTIAVYNSNEKICHPDLYKIVVEKGKISNIIHLLTCN